MIYLKSIAAGIAAAFAAVVVWLLAELVVPLLIDVLRSRSGGSGGIGFVFAPGGSLLVAAFVGFVAGCSWQIRRGSRATTIRHRP